jgi:hypothetical protein
MTTCLLFYQSNSSPIKKHENTKEEPDNPEPEDKGAIPKVILLLLVVQHKYRSSNKKLPVTAEVGIGAV